MTLSRKRKLTRRSDGTFQNWMGGKTKDQLKKKQNNFQGIAIHIGKEFTKQNNKTAQTGDTVRFKTLSGKHHKQAEWYVKTKYGWRKHGPAKPSKTYLVKVKEGKTGHRKGRK